MSIVASKFLAVNLDPCGLLIQSHNFDLNVTYKQVWSFFYYLKLPVSSKTHFAKFFSFTLFFKSPEVLQFEKKESATDQLSQKKHN
ncbi:hypothetical protein BpHYR1_053443 [Brachionus plicatilis]|uniref:Uncharacterized protein n=1 Tax=Brachionus plicatilis TaxID=10195 RepID=A0A3M7PEV0_BRAPC|nr:hypothetical protein BpHYR1_053443 [Brachionus plicatilis]